MQHYFLAGSFRYERRDDASNQDQDNGAIQHLIINKSEIISYEDNGKGGCCVGTAQPEHQVPLFPGITKNPSAQLSGDPFPEERHNGKGEGNDQGLRTVCQYAKVDEHSHTDQEERYKERISYEFNPVHQ